uniref:Uncharacterized protein n=1 Tax=Eutreptiella gymnastica TaxID=73025 RepID=A0A7S1HRJ1_9EUGL
MPASIAVGASKTPRGGSSIDRFGTPSTACSRPVAANTSSGPIDASIVPKVHVSEEPGERPNPGAASKEPAMAGQSSNQQRSASRAEQMVLVGPSVTTGTLRPSISTALTSGDCHDLNDNLLEQIASVRYSVGSVVDTFGFDLEGANFLLGDYEDVGDDALQGILDKHAETVQASDLVFNEHRPTESICESIAAAGTGTEIATADSNSITIRADDLLGIGDNTDIPNTVKADEHALMHIHVPSTERVQPAPLVPEVTATDVACFALKTIHGLDVETPRTVYPSPEGTSLVVDTITHQGSDTASSSRTTLTPRSVYAPYSEATSTLATPTTIQAESPSAEGASAAHAHLHGAVLDVQLQEPTVCSPAKDNPMGIQSQEPTVSLCEPVSCPQEPTVCVQPPTFDKHDLAPLRVPNAVYQGPQSRPEAAELRSVCHLSIFDAARMKQEENAASVFELSPIKSKRPTEETLMAPGFLGGVHTSAPPGSPTCHQMSVIDAGRIKQQDNAVTVCQMSAISPNHRAEAMLALPGSRAGLRNTGRGSPTCHQMSAINPSQIKQRDNAVSVCQMTAISFNHRAEASLAVPAFRGGVHMPTCIQMSAINSRQPAESVSFMESHGQDCCPMSICNMDTRLVHSEGGPSAGTAAPAPVPDWESVPCAMNPMDVATVISDSHSKPQPQDAVGIPTIVSPRERSGDGHVVDVGDLMRVATIPSMGASFCALDREPVLSDDEDETSTASSQHVGCLAGKEGKVAPLPTNAHIPVIMEPPSVIPGLLVIRVLQASPLPCTPATAYFVRARVGKHGGWSQTRQSHDATWCEDLILPTSGDWLALELRVYACEDGSGDVSPLPYAVGLCKPVLRETLNTEPIALMQLPLGSPPDDIGQPTLSIFVAQGHASAATNRCQSEVPRPLSLADQAGEGEILDGLMPGASVTRHPVRQLSTEYSSPWQVPNGPPRLEVSVVSGDNIFTKAEVQACTPEQLEVYVALGLPSVSRGWYRTGAQSGDVSVWNQMVTLPVMECNDPGVLEVRLYTRIGDRFLGQALVPLWGLQQDTVTTFKAKLGFVSEAGALIAPLIMAARELYLKVCPRRFSHIPCSEEGPHSYTQGWTYHPETQQDLLRQFAMLSSSAPAPPPLQRRDFLKDESPCVLELIVKEAREFQKACGGTESARLLVELRVGATVMETNVSKPGQWHWNEQFLAGLGIHDAPKVRITCFAQQGSVPRELGHGVLDLSLLPWYKGNELECDVRIMNESRVAGVVILVLTQRPAGVVQWLKWIQEESILLQEECDEAWRMGVNLEQKDRLQLLAGLEEGCRRTLLLDQQQQWSDLQISIQAMHKQIRELLQQMCTVRIKMVKTSRLYLIGDCYLILELGGQSFTTGCKSPTEQGIIMWNAECTLRHMGQYVDKVKLLTQPVKVALWYQGHLVGYQMVDLSRLHWRQQEHMRLTLLDGSMISLLVEALDFGLPPKVEDEEPKLELTVLSAECLPSPNPESCKPYIVLSITEVPYQGGVHRTSVRTGVSPVWKEHFVFNLPQTMPEWPKEVDLRIFDEAVAPEFTPLGAVDMQQGLIGSLTVPLTGLIRDRPVDFRLGLRIVSKGVHVADSTIHVRACARGFGQALPLSARSGTFSAAGFSPRASALKTTVASPRPGTQSHLSPALPDGCAPPDWNSVLVPEINAQPRTLGAPQDSPRTLFPEDTGVVASPRTVGRLATTVKTPTTVGPATTIKAETATTITDEPIRRAALLDEEAAAWRTLLDARPQAISRVTVSLGITIAQKMDENTGDSLLVAVAVRDGGPAAIAGLRTGDHVEAWNGIPLGTREEFAGMLRQAVVGQSILLTIVRDGVSMPIKILPVGAKPSQPSRPQPKRCEPLAAKASDFQSPRRPVVKRLGPEAPKPQLASPRHLQGPTSPKPRLQSRSPQQKYGTPHAQARALGDISNVG